MSVGYCRSSVGQSSGLMEYLLSGVTTRQLSSRTKNLYSLSIAEEPTTHRVPSAPGFDTCYHIVVPAISALDGLRMHDFVRNAWLLFRQPSGKSLNRTSYSLQGRLLYARELWRVRFGQTSTVAMDRAMIVVSSLRRVHVAS